MLFDHSKCNLQNLVISAVALTLPLSIELCNIAIALLIMYSIVNAKKALSYHKLKQNSGVLGLFIGFYLLHLLSALFFSTNSQSSHQQIEVKLTFCLFPILFFAFEFKDYDLRKILKIFIFGVCAVSIYCIFIAITLVSLTKNIEFLFYHSLASSINMSAIYLSYFVGIACIFCLDLMFKKDIKFKIGLWILPVLIGTLIILSAKMVLFTTVLIMVSMSMLRYLNTKNYLGILLVIVGIIFVATIIYHIPFVYQRFVESQFNFNSQDKYNENGLAGRIGIWKCAWTVISNNMIWGVGAGDSWEALIESYHKNNFALGIYWNYDTHNQYLRTWLGLGLVGLFYFLVIIMYSIYIGLKSKNLISVYFVLFFAICCLTESIFESQKGIVFFNFFNTLFLSYNLNIIKSQNEKGA